MQGAGEAVHVVGVDLHGIGQLAGSAGELRQHQHAAQVGAGGDEFLRDQVHDVVQRADDATGRDPVERINLLRPQVLVKERDRPPAFVS